MSRKETQYALVFDLEMTCWEPETPPEGEHAEIIEIGYCLLNLTTLEREPPVSVKVRPQQSRVSPFCTELTGWTEKALRSGQPLQEACKTLIYKRGLRQYPCFAWGADNETLRAECAVYGAEYPLSETYFNLSALYSILLGKSLRTGQATALEALEIEALRPFHVGANDAYNAAGILIELMKRARFSPAL